MKAAKTRLFRIMKNPTIVVGIAFGLGRIAQLLLGNYFAALATGLFSGGLLLSHVAFGSSPTRMTAGTVLTWRGLTAMGLLTASICLFGYDIGRALKRATRQTTTATPTR